MSDLINQNEIFEGVGIATEEDVRSLLKALEANEGVTDIANLTGGAALQPQSLEGTLALLTAQEKHLTLWKNVPKDSAVSTIEEYSMQLGYGMDDSGWVQQMETPDEADPYIKRGYSTIKFMRQIWKVSDVASMVTGIMDAEVVAKQSAVMRVLRRVNRTLYSGDSNLVPESIDGFETAIKNNGSKDHVRDLRGGVPTSDDFRFLAELITANLGNVEGAGLYVSPGGMTTIDSLLVPGQRFLQNQLGADGKIAYGWGVDRIHTSFGTIIPKVDIFLASEYEGKTVPKIPDPANPMNLIEGKTSAKAPDTPSIAVANVASVSGSLWRDTASVRPSNRTYRFRVAAGNRFGLSKACAAADAGAAVPEGGGIEITITPAGTGNPATYYEIYSEQVEGSGDYRLVAKVKATAPTTVYIDKNEDIPGTTKMFLLDLTSVGDMRSFTVKRLAPIFSQELAKIGAYRWGMVNMFLTPVYYAPLRFAMLKNVAIGGQSKSKFIEI